MTKLEELLQSLEGVKSIKPQKHAASFIALCPAHNDKRPSLCIDEAHNGKILIRCRSGCSAEDILNSIGMTMRDLFPADSYKRLPGPTVKQVNHALSVTQLVSADLSVGKEISQGDKATIQKAISILTSALKTAKS